MTRRAEPRHFNVSEFLPYLLNQAAETTSLEFQTHYRKHYGMLRTEWRVLFHLGQFGPMTATDISQSAKMHKTKISRAVQALQTKRFLSRETDPHDRRSDYLKLTARGLRTYQSLAEAAQEYEMRITRSLSDKQLRELKRTLQLLMDSRSLDD